MSKYGDISGPYFPVFRLNTVNLRTQSECRKMRRRKNSVFGHFSRSVRDVFGNSSGNYSYFILHKKFQKKFSIKDFFSKCDQIHSYIRIWSNLLKKSLMENFIFCAVIFHNFSNESDASLYHMM